MFQKRQLMRIVTKPKSTKRFLIQIDYQVLNSNVQF